MSLGGHHSITEVIGDVTRTLVPAISETEIQQRICETFAASESYSVAWIGRYNPEREEVIPAASSGNAENTLGGFTTTEESSHQELVNEVVRTREIAIRQNLGDDPPCEEWCEYNLDHGYQSCAFIPLVYEETLYGVLYLATDRPRGFGATERESLTEVGRTIAYACEDAESSVTNDSTGQEETEIELPSVTAEPEQELRLYETIISSTPDLVYAFDLDYRFIFANDALLEMWGQTLEESIGKTLLENGYEPWHAEMHERELDQVVETKEPIRGEVAFEHAELGNRIYDYIFAPVLNDEGDVEAIAGTTRDITERKETEEALQKSEERFRALVNASSDVVYRMSPDWSEMQYLEGQGFIANTHEPTSNWVDKYIHADDQAHVTEAIDEAIRTKSTFELEHRVEQTDGSLGWTFSRAIPMLDEDGDIVEWIGMASDITERKEMEQNLRESEARFRMLAENLEEIVWMATPDAEEFIYINPAFEDVWGLDRDELYDEPSSFLEAVHTDDRERVREKFAALPDEKLDEEFRIVHPDGEVRWVHARGTRVHDEGGGMARVVGTGEDITERKERQRQLEQSEQRYRVLAENFPNGVVGVYDRDLRYTLVAGEKIGGPAPSKEEAEGARMPDLYPDDAVADLEPQFRAAIEDGESGSVETEVVGRHWRVWATPLRNADGEIFAGLSFAQDITERKQREQHLERYETIVETINDGVYVVDEDGTFQMVNETYAKMLGYSPGELVGADASTVVDDEVIKQANELHGTAVEERAETPSMETKIQTASGDWVPVEATFAPMPKNEAADWHRVGVVRDISERKERERALEESERRYRTLIENFPNGSVGLFDEELRYTVVGGALFDNLDFDPEDRVGSRISDLHPPDLLDDIEPYFQAALDGKANSFDIEFQDRHLHANTHPIRNADDEVLAGMLVIQDVTERREYEHMLEESNERLEQFAYAASHDLQEPLRMVSSYLQLIEDRYDDELDEDGREFIEFAVDGADRMRNMIKGLLQYSRVETQGDPFEPVDLNDVFEDVCKDLQVRIEESDAEIMAESLPRVKGDAGQLPQVFQNLLDNAIEYSGDDPPRVRIDAERDGDWWQISVADEGIGIDVDDADRVFEVFESLHASDDYSGTGIGLALCERIVERHGGDIWVDSKPGEGATFSFTLPPVSSP